MTTQAQDASDISGGPEAGEWQELAEEATRMIYREMDGYKRAVEAGDGDAAKECLEAAGDWSAIFLAATALAGKH